MAQELEPLQVSLLEVFGLEEEVPQDEGPNSLVYAEIYMLPRTMQHPAWCLRGGTSPWVSLAGAETRQHCQVASHRGWARCGRGRDSFQLCGFCVIRHLRGPSGKLPYACGAWLLPWAAPVPCNSGDEVLAQSRGVALPFLLLNGVQGSLHFPICSHVPLHPNPWRW